MSRFSQVIFVVIFVTILTAANLAQATPKKDFGKRTIRISLSQSGWQATGVTLDGKRSVKVSAKGEGNYCGGSSQCNATPDGSVSGEAHCQSSTNAPFAPCGALIGRIGGGTPFIVGTGVSLPRGSKGALEIAIQDFLFEDNSGSFEVTIRGYSKEKYLISGFIRMANGDPFPNERLIIRGNNKRYQVKTDSNGFYSKEFKEGNYIIEPERQNAFPSSFSPLSSVEVNLPFTPRNRHVELLEDTTGQSFQSVKFAAVKSQMFKVKGKPSIGELFFDCILVPVPDRDIAQIAGMPNGTKILFSDSEREEIKVSVIGPGPFSGVKSESERFAAHCEGKLAESGGIGVPTFLLESGGSTAFVELAPR